MQDKIASSTIVNNVTTEVIKKVNKSKKTCDIMKIIETDYNKERTKDVGYYFNKLEKLKASKQFRNVIRLKLLMKKPAEIKIIR